MWGVGGSAFRNIGPNSDLTSNSQSITSVSHRYNINITSISHRYHISITSVSHRSAAGYSFNTGRPTRCHTQRPTRRPARLPAGPPRARSTYRILPLRASRKLNLSHTTSASLPPKAGSRASGINYAGSRLPEILRSTANSLVYYPLSKNPYKLRLVREVIS